MAKRDQKSPSFSLGVARSGTVVNHRQRVSPGALEVTFATMNGWEKRTIRFQAGDKVRFKFQRQIASGSLVLELIAPDGSTAIRWGDGPSATSEFLAGVEGKYTLRATAEHASGGYTLEIEPE